MEANQVFQSLVGNLRSGDIEHLQACERRDGNKITIAEGRMAAIRYEHLSVTDFLERRWRMGIWLAIELNFHNLSGPRRDLGPELVNCAQCGVLSYTTVSRS